jgi:hypothetical protein
VFDLAPAPDSRLLLLVAHALSAGAPPPTELPLDHPPTRLLVLREKDTMLELARQKLLPLQLESVRAELEAALALPDDEATLVLATIKSAWEL